MTFRAVSAEAPETPPSPEARALLDLEWGRIVAAVAERCRGPLRERLAALPLAESKGEAKQALRETREAYRQLQLDDPLPIEGAREVGASLSRLSRQGDLDGPALYAIASTLGAARVLRRYLHKRREAVPGLYAACSLDPTLDAVKEDLLFAVEADGTLADSASPDLRRLRVEVQHLRARIVSRLEAMLLKHADIVQDRFHTVREGRYVVPVRTDAHEKLPGIVHGTSGSGATVFVEPRDIVQVGNRLKMAEGELEREVGRILSALSARVAERLPELRAACEGLDRADLRQASAQLAVDLGAVVVDLDEEAVVDLVDARHPLLELDGANVVPNDLSLAAGRGLVFSGPNAGGKTVSLKLLGLSALMVRAGLPLPAGEGSRAGFFAPVLTDVGDDQSIARNLSTFSAHIRNLVELLDASRGDAMVLLDEVATGTDPGEGGALACALIDDFCQSGAAVAVTTHYEPLKAMASADPRLENASVGFDVSQMRPTFRVRRGVPGSSSALAVASRFGIPARIVERAAEMLPEGSRRFEALVGSLNQKVSELEAERAVLEAARAEAEGLRDALRKECDALAARDRKALSAEAEAVMQALRRARGEVKDVRKQLRVAEDQASLETLRARLRRVAGEVEQAPTGAQKPAPERASAAVDTPRPSASVADAVAGGTQAGRRVFLPRLKSEGEVLEGPTKGKVRVAAGPLKLWVEVEDVVFRDAGSSSPVRSASQGSRIRDAPAEASPASASAASGDASAMPNADNTLDLRGMRVDDALTMAEGFLDRLYGRSEPVAFLLHGVGSGALRDALRTHLGRHAEHYVRRIRPGTLEEGGERITVVYLR